jgi:hypothetical protein
VQALPNQNIEDYVVPVGVDVAESGVFKFSATQEKLDNYSLLLEDRKENTFTDLRWDNYFTTINQSGTGRFFLHFKDATSIGENPEEPIIRINATDRAIVIHGAIAGIISLLDLTGRVIIQHEFNGAESIPIPANLQTGVYLVTVQNGSEIKTEKVMIK